MSEAPKIRLPKTRKRAPKNLGNPISEFAMIPAHVLYDPWINNAALRVFAVMCHHANSRGTTYISQATIAQKLGLTRTAVTNQMKVLLEHFYIHRTKPPSANRRAAHHRIVYDRDQMAIFRQLVARHTHPIDSRERVMRGDVNRKSLSANTKKENKQKKESFDDEIRLAIAQRYAAEGLPPPSEAVMLESIAAWRGEWPQNASESPTSDDRGPGKGDIAR